MLYKTNIKDGFITDRWILKKAVDCELIDLLYVFLFEPLAIGAIDFKTVANKFVYIHQSKKRINEVTDIKAPQCFVKSELHA